MAATAREGAYGIKSLEARRKDSRSKFKLPTGAEVYFKPLDEAEAGCEEDGAEFINLVQYMERSDNGVKYVRFAYYRRALEKTKWIFGSQTSLALSEQDMTSLLREACKKPWFRKLVEEAMQHRP